MLNDLTSSLPSDRPMPMPPILSPQSVKRCHVYLPDTPKPTSAILYSGQFYCYVKSFSDLESAQRAVDRLLLRGNTVVLTKVAKGLVLWVLELEAQPASKHLV